MDSSSVRWHLEGGTYRCAECSSTFSSESAVETHFRTSHNTSSHYCAQCQMNFKDSWHLKRHLFTHGVVDPDTPQVKNACALCGASFSDGWHLRQHLKTHEGGDLPATAPRRRGRRRGRPCSVLGHISTMESKDLAPEWSAGPQNSPNAEEFYDNYEKLEGLRPETREFYCGICGEGVCRSRFACHSLLHMHDVFEVRRGKVEPLLQDVEEGECGQCQSLSRRLKAMMQVIDGAINQSCLLGRVELHFLQGQWPPPFVRIQYQCRAVLSASRIPRTVPDS